MLGADEVKEKFDDHHLKVDEKSISRLFKLAAMNRERLDPCNELSLYEFSIFSKKASTEFQKLMNGIKTDMLSTLIRRGTSTLNIGVIKRTEVDGILPKRKSAYLKFLPSTFNSLMNHFKDEELRNDIRSNLAANLKEVMSKSRSKKELENALGSNAEQMKELIRSHFPEEEIDDEARRLFTQSKKSVDSLKKLKEKTRGIYALQRRSSMNLDRLSHLFKKREENQGPRNEDLYAKKQREFGVIIKNAKKLGQIEARDMLRRNCHSTRSVPLLPFSNPTSASGTPFANGKLLILALPKVKPKPSADARKKSYNETYMDKLLKENLVIHTNRSQSKPVLVASPTGEGLSSTETWVGASKESQLLEGSMCKTMPGNEAFSNDFKPTNKTSLLPISKTFKARHCRVLSTIETDLC